jgi:hypothetical protein
LRHPISLQERCAGQLLSYSISMSLKMKKIHPTLFRRREATCTRSAESCCRFVPPYHRFLSRNDTSERSTDSDRESALPLLYPRSTSDECNSKGAIPKRPRQELVTDRQWTFMQRCWMPLDAGEPRPGDEEIVEFVRQELVDIEQA